MAFVSTTSGLFKVVKRALWEYANFREQEARDLNREFTRPAITEHHIQVTADVLKRRRGGEKDAAVERTQKVGFGMQKFINDFLDGLNVKEFLRTGITLRQGERDEFRTDVRAVMKASPERRQALLDVINQVLPKVEGLGVKHSFTKALENGQGLSEFIEYIDVVDDSARAEEE